MSVERDASAVASDITSDAPVPDPIAHAGVGDVAQGLLLRWETLLVLLIIVAGAWNTYNSEYFLSWSNLFDMTSQFMEKAMMALPMTFIIITGGIDLSISSVLALAGVSFGLRYSTTGDLPGSMALAMAIGLLCGFANGMLVTRIKLHPLVVTLGSMALYRGLAQVVLGDTAVGSFPDQFNALAGYVGKSILLPFGDLVPWPLLIFIVAAIAAGLVLHRTSFGRLVYAIGNNEDACRYSGIAVDRIKVILYTASGLVAAFAGLAYAAFQGAARWDMGTGFELDVITAVVLGGTDINGGSGSMGGTVLALFLIGILRNGMGLANIGDQDQMIVVGGLLIFSILGPTLAQRLGLRRRIAKGG
jgi:rhamnose transport system permease protein